jgi:hypothetical protein
MRESSRKSTVAASENLSANRIVRKAVATPCLRALLRLSGDGPISGQEGKPFGILNRSAMHVFVDGTRRELIENICGSTAARCA